MDMKEIKANKLNENVDKSYKDFNLNNVLGE